MIQACGQIILFVAVLNCYALAQTQTIGEPHHKWPDCGVDLMFSEATFGPNFSLKVWHHGTPVSGARIKLNKAVNASGDGIVASARTDSRGIARFRAIPKGRYYPDSLDRLLFPLYLIIEVKTGEPTGKSVTLDWPDHPIVIRKLRGRLSISEEPDTPNLPLRNATVELRDVYTSRLLETASTDANGDYEFTTSAPGLYALRLVLPTRTEADFENRDLAVELDPSAKEFSISEMKVVQSGGCHYGGGVQLLRKSSVDDRWEAQ